MSAAVSPSRDSGLSVSHDQTRYGPLPSYLNANVAVHVLISTLAGSHEGYDFFNNHIKTDLDAAHPSYKVTLTDSPYTIPQFAQSTIYMAARAGQEQTIILLSGDGGVSDIVDTLHACIAADPSHSMSTYKPPNIALIPMGTANALAHSTNLGDPKVAVSRLFGGVPRTIPTFTVTLSPGAQMVTDEGRKFVPVTATIHGSIVFSWGLHASLVGMSDTVEYRKQGVQRFQNVAAELMKDPHSYRGRVSVLPSSRLSGTVNRIWHPLTPPSGKNEHSYILATLVRQLEEKFIISPNNTPLSCNLRLLAMPVMTAPELGRILGLAYQGGKHISEKHIVYQEIDGLKLNLEEDDAKWRTICVDGRIIEVEKGGWVEVLREGEEGRVVALIS